MDDSALLESVKLEFDDSTDHLQLLNFINFENIKQEDDISKVTSPSNIKEEYRAVYNECISTHNESQIKMEIKPTINYHEETLDWKIKNEELDIKEVLEECETSFSSDSVCQKKSNQFGHETLLKPLSFKKHLKSNHLNNKKESENNSKEVFKCNECDFQNKYKNSLQTHLLQHNPDKVQQFKCDQCSFKTVFKSSLSRHLLRHKHLEDVEMFKCNKCDFQTIHKHNLIRHKLQHTNPGEDLKKFICHQCSYQAISPFYLNRHNLRHRKPEEVEMLKCDKCAFQTIRRQSLKLHLIRHKDPDEIEMFKCIKCDFQTIHKYYLKTHLLQHIN